MKRKALYGAMVLLFAAACSTGDLGGVLGDILGSSTPDDRSDVQGVVTYVDTNARRIDLDVRMVNNLRDERSGQSIYYDQNTVVEFGGKRYEPTQLERGDEVRVVGSNENGRYVADTITVVRDVS